MGAQSGSAIDAVFPFSTKHSRHSSARRCSSQRSGPTSELSRVKASRNAHASQRRALSEGLRHSEHARQMIGSEEVARIWSEGCSEIYSQTRRASSTQRI